MSRSRGLQWLRGAAVGVGIASSAAQPLAAIVEEVVEIPVKVVEPQGATVSRRITVTIFRDQDRPRAPFLILNHGRAPREVERAKLGRFRGSGNARYLVAKGFAVFAPTRLG